MLLRVALALVLAAVIVAIVAWIRVVPDAPARSDEIAAASASLRAVAVEKEAASPRGGTGTLSAPLPEPAADPAHVTVAAPQVASASKAFDVYVRLDAPVAMHRVLFAISYDKRVLALTGVSEGDLAQRVGLPADLATDEPSEGSLHVSFTVPDGFALTGKVNLAVLHFEPRKPGTVSIAVPRLTAYDRAGAVRFSDASSPSAIITVY
jgi:hypothetical protein